MEEINGIEKQEIYRNMKANLSKARKAGFDYEAIFIEYAIIEDRCSSLLRHAGIKILNKDGKEISITAKLNKLRGNPKFCDPYVRKRLPLELLDRIENWKEKRNKLIHALAKIPYDNDDIKQTAGEGNELVRLLDNAAKSINTYRKKMN